MLALTGTADASTQKTIVEELLMSASTTKIFLSPNRVNLKFSVTKVKKQDMMKQLEWVVQEGKEKGVEMAKMIIFCNSLVDIAGVVNWLMMRLGSAAFHPQDSRKRKDCIIGIYHSLSLEQNKERVTSSFKGSGLKRIVIATTALSMGVNFPDVRFVLMFGPPRSILDFHQEAGRAGRDGVSSDVILYFHGQQLTHCEDEMKTLLNSCGCIRVAAYKSLDSGIVPLQPGHACCRVCAAACECGAEDCTSIVEQPDSPEDRSTKEREVSDEVKELLLNSLKEIKQELDMRNEPIVPFGCTHGFSNELIEDVIENAGKLFSLEDIVKYVPVFSLHHAAKILEVLCEIFDDCVELSDLALQTTSLPTGGHIDLLLESEYEEMLESPDLDFL